MRSWPVIPRGVSHLFDHGHVESLKKKILGEILACHTRGVSHLLTMHVLNLWNNSRWDPGLSYQGGSAIFWPCTYWIFKEKNSRWDPGLSYQGGQSSFDHAHVESLEQSRWDPGLSYWGVNHSWELVHHPICDFLLAPGFT